MTQSDRRGAIGAMIAIGAAATASGADAAMRDKGDSTARQLDELVSRTQITEVLLDYARANDRFDEQLLRSCFWPESTHKHGRFEGLSSDFAGFALKVLASIKYACHHITNISVTVDGDRAVTECYYNAHHRRVRKEGDGEEDAFFVGRYLDIFERRHGVWKIIRRRGLSDYSPPPIPAATLYADWPAGQHSLRAPDDEYYAMVANFRRP
jgi:hypothetical protein